MIFYLVNTLWIVFCCLLFLSSSFFFAKKKPPRGPCGGGDVAGLGWQVIPLRKLLPLVVFLTVLLVAGP
jgi:hypothetical protein